MKLNWARYSALVVALPGVLAFAAPGPGLPSQPKAYSLFSYDDPAWTSARTSDDLSRFVGNRRGDYILPWRGVDDQVGESMSGPPDDKVLLPNGARILSGCRRHSCDEKGAFVVSNQDKVQAVALIHFHCRFERTAEERRRRPKPYVADYKCDPTRTLTLFLRRDGAYREALEQWAESVLEGRLLPGERIRTEVVWVDRPAR